MEHEFFITEVGTVSGEITLIPIKPPSKIFINVVIKTEKITIEFPDPPKVKMTLEEVCKELGKDIEIVDYGVMPKGHNDEDDFSDPKID